MENGIFDPDQLNELVPYGDYLLVNPGAGRIGWQGKQWLQPQARSTLNSAAIQFRAQTGLALYVSEAWRSLDSQKAYFFERYVSVEGPTSIQYAGSYWAKKSGAASAAVPGTSNHGLGIAVDLGSGINESFTADIHTQWDAICKPYGWYCEGVNFGEPWHYKFDAQRVTIDSAGSGTPVPINPEVEDMTPDQWKVIQTMANAINDPNNGVLARMARLEGTSNSMSATLGDKDNVTVAGTVIRIAADARNNTAAIKTKLGA